MPQKSKFLSVPVLLILLLLSGCAATKLIIGSSLKETPKEKLLPVIAIGIGNSKEDALKRAFRDAVEKTVGVYIDSTTMVKNAQLIEDKILQYSGGYIKEYTILEEKPLDDGTYLTRIQAIIIANNVELDLSKNEVFKIEGEDVFKNKLTQASTMYDRNMRAYEIAKDLFFEGYPNIASKVLATKNYDDEVSITGVKGYPNNAYKVLVTKFDIVEVGIKKEATVGIGLRILRNNLWYNRFRNLLIAMNDSTQRGVVDLTSDIPAGYDYGETGNYGGPPTKYDMSCGNYSLEFERFVINYGVFEYIVKSIIDTTRYLRVSFYNHSGKKIDEFFGTFIINGNGNLGSALFSSRVATKGAGFDKGKKTMKERIRIFFSTGSVFENYIDTRVLAVVNQSGWDSLCKEFSYKIIIPFDVIENIKDIKAELSNSSDLRTRANQREIAEPIQKKQR